jgi:hypothetical protein
MTICAIDKRRKVAADVEKDADRAKQMRGAKQQRDMVERRDALGGDDRFVLILGLANVEIERFGETDARPGVRLANLFGESA